MLGFNLGFPTRQINICIMYLKEVQFDVWVTSGDPERNDILRLEDDVKATSDDPARNDILRLDEMMRRKSMLINSY